MMSAVLAWALAAARVLTLAEAVRIAEQHQPVLLQARADIEAAKARVIEARAPLLPQVTGTFGYQRTTANFAPRPGTVPQQFQTVGRSSLDTFNFFTLNGSATQLIYDFGQTPGEFRSAQWSASAQEQNGRQRRLEAILAVETAYFSACAAKAIARVADETLANQERHLDQIERFVEVGTRPAIDLAQARTDRANAEVARIEANNGYALAKAQLNQAMGSPPSESYEVAEETMPALEGEQKELTVLLEESIRNIPQFQEIESRIAAQQQRVRSERGAYGPSLSAGTSVTDVGSALDNLVWNWNASVTLTWLLFQGLGTKARVREAEAMVASLEAQRQGLIASVRLEVEQAMLDVGAARSSIGATTEALANARERLRLAEGRYQAGLGNSIELGDAQVAASNAAAQKVRADYNLATARAKLKKALGRT